MKISDCNGDQKRPFKIVYTLLGRNKRIALPKYDSHLTMASVINIFFIDKIDNNRVEIPLLIYFNVFYYANMHYYFNSF